MTGTQSIMNAKTLLLLFAVFASVCKSAEQGEFKAVLPIEHNVGNGGTFVPRGELEFVVSSKQKRLAVKFLEPEYSFSAVEVQGFQKLLSQNSRYTVRVAPEASVKDSQRMLLASIPACALLQEDFEEVFHFHVEKSGDILGFEYAQFDASNIDCGNAKVPNSITLKTLAMASLPTEAFIIPKTMENVAAADPVVPGMVTEDSKGPEKEGENENQQSFMRRYWYVILPIVISFLIPADWAEGVEEKAGTAPPSSGAAKKRSKKSRN